MLRAAPKPAHCAGAALGCPVYGEVVLGERLKMGSGAYFVGTSFFGRLGRTCGCGGLPPGWVAGIDRFPAIRRRLTPHPHTSFFDVQHPRDGGPCRSPQTNRGARVAAHQIGAVQGRRCFARQHHRVTCRSVGDDGGL